jgi:DNA-binding NarL/FixJ family response regulator
MTIRVLVADDQALVRAGFVALLDAQDGIAVIAEADTGTAALSAARELRPDVVLMDIRMPEMDGLAATRAIAADPALAEVRVVVLTTFELDEYVTHVSRILTKLGARDRTQLVVIAYESGLVRPGWRG